MIRFEIKIEPLMAVVWRGCQQLLHL